VENGSLVGYDTIRAWYSPFVHRELPSEVAKLRDADDAAIIKFALIYGGLDYSSFAASDPLIDFDISMIGKDPLVWIRAHASGIHICLSLTDALARRLSPNKLTSLLWSFDHAQYANGAQIRAVSLVRDVAGKLTWHGAPADPLLVARQLRASIINPNLSSIVRHVMVADDGKDRTHFGYYGRASVLYWHLANLIDGGTVKRCEARDCGAFFIQNDPRQKNCPPRWHQTESLCAQRARKRRQREKHQQEG
jgi:hypothetical protein